jgi:FAD/FMN-containing dehydrogenase
MSVMTPARAARQELNGFAGRLIGPEDADYDETCKVYNAMIDKRPALIASCTSPEDVAKAVGFARDHDLLLAVRGGGHNGAGLGTCDDGVVIDLSPLKDIQVDPEARTVRVGGGCTWGEVDRATNERGLATPSGIISTTGVGGLTLGGGIGHLTRKFGLTIDNLLEAELVLASGERVRASADENADLFWGLRGGGGNFGVVTSFEYRLHPVTSILGGMLLYPFEQAGAVLRAARDFNQSSPDEMSIFGVLLTSPEGAKVVALLVCYNGPIEQGEALLRPLRENMSPIADLVAPITYEQQQTLLDEGFPFGLQNYWKSEFLKSLPDAAIDVLVEQFSSVPSPLSALVLEQFGGAYRRVGAEETAFAHRDWDYNFLIISRWTDPAEADQHIQWARGVWQAVQPYASGSVYVNYLEPGQEGADRIRAAYGPVYDRLVALKNQYDPTNFFRLNQNIQPTG